MTAASIAETDAPDEPFSMSDVTTILGFSIGANAVNQQFCLPFPTWAVPDFPHTVASILCLV